MITFKETRRVIGDLYYSQFERFSWVRCTMVQMHYWSWHESAVICLQSYKTLNLLYIWGTRSFYDVPLFLGIWLRPVAGEHIPQIFYTVRKMLTLRIIYFLHRCLPRLFNAFSNTSKCSSCVLLGPNTFSMYCRKFFLARQKEHAKWKSEKNHWLKIRQKFRNYMGKVPMKYCWE